MTESKKEDQIYFGVQKTATFHFPGDDEQFIVHKKLNEGDRQLFEDRTGRQVSFDRATDEVKMDLSSGKERAVLFDLVMVSYKVKVKNEKQETIFKEGSDQPGWETLVKMMDGDLAQKFLDAIRELNPWLKTGEADVKAKEAKN